MWVNRPRTNGRERQPRGRCHPWGRRGGSAPGRILFQPYLQGERTPHNDVAARGAFIGLDATSDSVDLARAVLEGVAYSLRLGQELLAPRAGDLSFIGLVGGGARSALWSEIVASILGRSLAIVEDADFVAALGAARVSMIAMGAPLTDVAALPRVARTVEPERRWAVAYSERFARFRKAYAALRPLT